ncbi:MAG TPA: imidazolonepropionase [Acidimicrobiia bacterium]|nr:imidazolonepropionase [Acidimicrobiia bacterium]
MTLVIDRIGELVTNDPESGVGPLGLRHDVAVAVTDGLIAAIGPSGSLTGDHRIDAAGAAALPGFVDSHTHLVFAGDRSGEFAARMGGEPYRAAGIAETVTETRAASDATLSRLARRRLAQARAGGTTHIEIKSGYGLTPSDESRILAVAGELTGDTTFLGAHVVPSEYAGRGDDYVALVTGEMLSACAGYARWIDVFCEQGAFDEEQSRAVLTAGRAAGLGLKVHANQLGPGPGVRLAVEMGAVSADHCTHLTDGDIEALAGADTVATFLPAADYSTRQPYPDARRCIDAGVKVAIASNCNPGSSNTTSIPFCLGLAVREMGMTAAEAIRAATTGGSAALGRTDLGRVVVGARADLQVLDAPSHAHLIYQPGVALTALTLVAGESVFRRQDSTIGGS